MSCCKTRRFHQIYEKTMVYCGKPSKACENCRQRRLKVSIVSEPRLPKSIHPSIENSCPRNIPD